MKTVVTLWAITAFLAVVGWQLAFHRGNTINRIENSLKQCEIRNRENDDYIEAKDKTIFEDSQTIGKLREQIKKAVSVCDCYNSRADDVALDILHNHHKRKQ